MAQKLICIDDRTGEEGAETVCVRVWLPGSSGKAIEFEIDLADAGQDELAAALRPFIKAGRLHKTRGATPPDAFIEGVPDMPPRALSMRHTREDVDGCRQFLEDLGITPPSGKFRNVFWEAYYQNNPDLIPAEFRPVHAATG